MFFIKFTQNFPNKVTINHDKYYAKCEPYTKHMTGQNICTGSIYTHKTVRLHKLP